MLMRVAGTRDQMDVISDDAALDRNDFIDTIYACVRILVQVAGIFGHGR